MFENSLNPADDPFGPPAISTIVQCIHCGEEYDSYKIEWRVEHDADGQSHGFWCCPILGCDGKGFGFDIFPVDPEYRDENGELMWFSDDDEFDDEDDAYISDFAELDELDDAEAELTPDEEAPSSGAWSDRDEERPL